MKIFKILPIIIFSFLAVSCRMDEPSSAKDIVEGIPVTVTVPFKVSGNNVITKGAQNPQEEYKVENLYVFIFNSESGEINAKKFEDKIKVDSGDDHCTGTIQIEAKTTKAAKIIGIANLKTETNSTAYTVTKEQLDEIQSYEELKDFVMDMKDQSVERLARFMMTGYAKKTGDSSTDIPIEAGEAGGRLDCTLILDRTDAKIEINVKTSPERYTDFAFYPNGIQIFRIPAQTLLLASEDENTDATVKNDGSDAVYFNTNVLSFDYLTKNDQNMVNGGQYVFYMPENRKAPKKQIDGSKYGEREQSIHVDIAQDSDKQGQQFENGEFEYANDNSTYAVITGVVSYTDIPENNSRPVNAAVKICIHLGGVKNNTLDANNYETLRNTYYKYNITIKDINSIILEVESSKPGEDGQIHENEQRPGYEGDVIYASGDLFELDSHYDRAYFELDSRSFDIKDPNSFRWSVKTYFSNGMHTVGDLDFTGVNDYKWIKFAINNDYDVARNTLVKYPGDQNYLGGGNQPSGYNQHPENARLLDVDQLLSRIKEEIQKNQSSIIEGDGKICITAFVDENIYVTNPNDGSFDLKLWKETVGIEARQLHIVARGSQYSPDGNSSIVNSLVSFRQKSIQTLFNTQKADLETGWGIESTLETGRIRPYIGDEIKRGTDRKNGRQNTVKILTEGNKASWTDILSVEDKYELKQGYEAATYACLMKNRDLNGNNVIEANEIRWYLAAIDQLTEMFIGEMGLSEEARLYPLNASDRPGGNSVYWHYTSSSNHDGTNPWVLWAEEGASIGKLSDSKSSNGELYSYRCLRNLGLPIDQPENNYQALITYTTTGNEGQYVLDMSNMNENARRSASTVNPLPAHNERDIINNKPYVKFEMHKDPSPYPETFLGALTNKRTWNELIASNPCPTGYRMPNHREFLIMTSVLPGTAWPDVKGHNLSYTCQTAFSMCGSSPETTPYNSFRQTFWWDRDGGNFFLQNIPRKEWWEDWNDVWQKVQTGYVRCVRDVQ